MQQGNGDETQALVIFKTMKNHMCRHARGTASLAVLMQTKNGGESSLNTHCSVHMGPPSQQPLMVMYRWLECSQLLENGPPQEETRQATAPVR